MGSALRLADEDVAGAVAAVVRQRRQRANRPRPRDSQPDNLQPARRRLVSPPLVNQRQVRQARRRRRSPRRHNAAAVVAEDVEDLARRFRLAPI